jgi:hypothetical protein
MRCHPQKSTNTKWVKSSSITRNYCTLKAKDKSNTIQFNSAKKRKREKKFLWTKICLYSESYGFKFAQVCCIKSWFKYGEIVGRNYSVWKFVLNKYDSFWEKVMPNVLSVLEAPHRLSLRSSISRPDKNQIKFVQPFDSRRLQSERTALSHMIYLWNSLLNSFSQLSHNIFKNKIKNEEMLYYLTEAKVLNLFVVPVRHST